MARLGVGLVTAETVGQRLRRLRLERGLSQRQLSEPGVSYAYISRVEADTRQPSTKALRKLAPKLGVTANYLEFGVEVDPVTKSVARKVARLTRRIEKLERELERERERTQALRLALREELRR